VTTKKGYGVATTTWLIDIHKESTVVAPDESNTGSFEGNSNTLAARRDRPEHRLVGSALLILLGISLGVIVAEAAVRLFGLAKPVFLVYSATRGWKLRAGARGWQLDEGRAFVRVNRWGYRGKDWTPSKPNGTLRIAVLGDSFVEAPQVAQQDTACEVIQRELSRKLSSVVHGRLPQLKRVDVLNFGVDGYGTAQEYFTLLEDVWRFSPNMVVLAFFPGNDVRNNSAVLEGDKCRAFFVPHGNGVALGGPFEQSISFRFGCFLRFESYHSQLLNILGEARSTIRSIQRKRRDTATDLNRVIHHPVAVSTKVLPQPGINDLIYRPPVNRNWTDAWNVSEAEIDMTKQNVRAHHALFLLVIIGTGIQVMPDAAFQARYLKAVGGTDLLYPSHRLGVFGAREGFAVLDLVPPMRTYAQEHQVYFHGFPNTAMGTGHWNQRGNRIAGCLIADKIATMLGTDGENAKPSGSACLL
jgi:hypothetical protein